MTEQQRAETYGRSFGKAYARGLRESAPAAQAAAAKLVGKEYVWGVRFGVCPDLLRYEQISEDGEAAMAIETLGTPG